MIKVTPNEFKNKITCWIIFFKTMSDSESSNDSVENRTEQVNNVLDHLFAPIPNGATEEPVIIPAKVDKPADGVQTPVDESEDEEIEEEENEDILEDETELPEDEGQPEDESQPESQKETRYKAPVDRLTQLPLSRVKNLLKNFDPEWAGQNANAAIMLTLVCYCISIDIY